MDPGKSGALKQVPCANCGKAVLTFDEDRLSSSRDCPICRQRTTVYAVAGNQVVFSEQRLLRIFSYTRSKKWTCPQHDGAPLEITGIVPQAGNPLQLTIRFLCKRSRNWSNRSAHSGSLTVDILTLEAEMLASAPR